MDGHLVAVEVGIEGGADQGVDLDGAAVDEDGFKGLNAETVEGGGAIQEDRTLLDNLVQNVPDLRAGALYDALGGLDVESQAAGPRAHA